MSAVLTELEFQIQFDPMSDFIEFAPKKSPKTDRLNVQGFFKWTNHNKEEEPRSSVCPCRSM